MNKIKKIKLFLHTAVKLSPILIVFILFLYMTAWINNPLLSFSFLLFIYYVIFHKKYDFSKIKNSIKTENDNFNSKKQFKSERVFSEEDRTFEIRQVDKNLINAINILKLNSSIELLTLKEIKKAYKREAKIYHPDNNGDIEKMKEINKAYALLKELVIVQPTPTNKY